MSKYKVDKEFLLKFIDNEMDAAYYSKKQAEKELINLDKDEHPHKYYYLDHEFYFNDGKFAALSKLKSRVELLEE